MGQTPAPIQPKERRISNIHEIALGFWKKENLNESRRCPQCAVASCIGAEAEVQPCALGVDIPGFIRLLREDDVASALERIRLQNPFPAICGRICPAPCERACVFEDEGSAISIRTLERYAADFGKLKVSKLLGAVKGRKVAIIGSGPAGMSAAYYLAKEGYGVSIFEAMDEPGGILRYGVPEFRLPQRILDEQFAELSSMGVKIETNAFVGSTIAILDIFTKGFSGILLAVGAGQPTLSSMPGDSLGGVYYAHEFLMRAQQQDKSKVLEGSKAMICGSQMAVIGRGYPALDAARIGLRQGLEVNLIFNGMEEELGLREDDLKLAVEEGLKVLLPYKALSVKADHLGFAKALECAQIDVVEEDDQLLLKETCQEPILIDAQTIILATPGKPNNFLGKQMPQLQWDADGSLCVDEQTGLTNLEKVFACGNVVTGAGAVVDAIASGKQAAQKIKGFLNQ